MLGCVYTICLYGRIEISCTFPSPVSPCTPSVLICCIRLLCDWSFRLRHRIANIYCFVASYLFSLWYDWFFWRCPVLLLGVTPWEFFTSVLAEGLSLKFKWQHVSWTLLSITAVLNNVVVLMVSTRPPTSKSSSPINNPLVNVPKVILFHTNNKLYSFKFWYRIIIISLTDLFDS